VTQAIRRGPPKKENQGWGLRVIGYVALSKYTQKTGGVEAAFN